MICKSNSIKNNGAKATLLFSLFCFLVTFNIGAQDIHFGVKGGLNYSSIIGNLTEGLKFRFSGHGGIFLQMELSDKFALQPEVLYSSQGFQYSTDLAAIQNGTVIAGDNDFRTNVQLNYLTVPILGKFALGNEVTLDFGPQFGFLLNQVTKIKNLDELEDSNTDERNLVSGDFQLDYGAAIGLGIKVNEQFSVSPRFYIGLRNRLNGLPDTMQNYNVAIQLSVNYTFP
ncbi:porin family protein [Maribacter halichondriae]|uniref:porin family protein n=1 Tax=Maribacter halichondriae TaxID=2980554 RepID=UPI002358F64B|nr:porin family protein [Maribacter sp. Hal144]